MTEMALPDIARAMRKIDFAMLFTRSSGGELAGRPMSNNGKVEYDGESIFFAYADTRTVSDLEGDSRCALSYQGAAGLLGAPPLFIAIEGHGSVVRDKAAFAEHWTADLDRWFPDGIDTPGLAMIRVLAVRLHYWSGRDEGELALGRA